MQILTKKFNKGDFRTMAELQETPKRKTSDALLRAIKKYRQKKEVREKDRIASINYYYSHRTECIDKKLKSREDNKELFLVREAKYRARTRDRISLLKHLPFFKTI